MLKGGSLYYALTVALLIALLCGGLILFASGNRTQLQWSRRMTEVRLNAGSGMNLMLAAPERIPAGQKTILDLYGRQRDSVELLRREWGLFEVCISRAFSGSERFVQAGLAGYRPDTASATALFLADLDRPLSLCGKTELRGSCLLPKAGLKRAYIEGQTYSGSQMVYGTVKNSERFLPQLQEELIGKLERLQRAEFGESDSLADTGSLYEKDTLRQSFLSSPCCFYQAGPLRLSGIYLSGQILIVSGSQITVESDAGLDGVILVAPKIIFREKFKGRVQAIARDSLLMEKEVALKFPSVAAVIGQDNGPDQAVVWMQEKDTLEGTLLAYRKITDFRKQVTAKLDKETQLTGFLYSTGLTDLKGTVYGQVTTMKFLLATPSAVYENHLLNAVIDRSKLPEAFAAGAVFRERGKRTLIAKVN